MRRETGKTITEIAKARRVSRQAVDSLRDRRDIKPIGRRGRVNLYNPADFEEKEKAKREGKNGDYKERIDRGRAEKLELENQKKRGELVDRALVSQVFGEIYSVHRSILLNIGPGLSDSLAAISDTAAAEKTLKMQELIDNEIYSALAAIKAAINKFLRQVKADEINDSLPEPKPKPTGKQKKKPS